MSTQDVPGANPANADVLAAGCWAAHEDGSLLYVKGTENQQVVYELYDMSKEPVIYYQDAMREDAFKKSFSYPPVGASPDKWVWHDKTNFPWHKVMKTFSRPTPQHADVHDTLSAAARVAESLRLRAQQLEPEMKAHLAEQQLPKAAHSIGDRIKRAIDAFMGE